MYQNITLLSMKFKLDVVIQKNNHEMMVWHRCDAEHTIDIY